MALKAQTKAVFGGYLTLHLDRGAGAWGESKKRKDNNLVHLIKKYNRDPLSV